MYLTLTDKIPAARIVNACRKARAALAFLAACLALCLAFPACGAAAGNPAGLQMTITSGFDGRCKMGGLNPVVVEVESGESGCSGTVTLKASERVYTCLLQLEKETKKTMRFSVPFYGADEKIEAVFEGQSAGPVKAEHVPAILPGNTLFVGILSDHPENLYYLKDLDAAGLGGGGVETVELDGEFDYSQAELENINFIVIDDFNTTGLGAAGTGLLKDWVSLGNCLLAGAGDSRQKTLTGLLAGLSVPSLLGDGVVVPVDGGIAGSTAESVSDTLLKHITPYAVARAVRGSGLLQRSNGAAKLSGAAEEALRPEKGGIYFVFSLLLLYLLAAWAAALAGQRFRWAYGAVIAFFCLLFLGLSLPSGIFRAAAGAAGVRVYGAVNRDYFLTCVYPYRGKAARVAIPGAAFASVPGGVWAGDARSREIYCSGDAGHYMQSSSYGPGGGLDNALTLGGDGVISGEITNPLPYTLENCFLLVGDTVIPVGKMAGREKFRVRYTADHGLKDTGDYNYLDRLGRAAGVLDQRRQMIEYYFYNLEDYKPGGRLIGFSRETAGLEVNGSLRNIRRTVLNVFPIDLKGGEGGINLPPEVIRPVAGQHPAGESESRREYTGEAGGELRLYYVMPPGLKEEEIKFTEAAGSERGSVSLYNRAVGGWDKLEEGSLAGEKLREYLSGGPLVLSIGGGSRTLVPQMAVKGVAER